MVDKKQPDESEKPQSERSLLSIDASMTGIKKKFALKLWRRKFTIVLVAVLLFVSGYFILTRKNNAGLAARVGDTKIKKIDVEKVVTDSQGSKDYKAALDLMIETEQYQQFAKTQNLNLTAEELDAVIADRLTPERANTFETNAYSRYVVLNAGLKQKLEKETTGTASGVLYQFDGSRFYPTDLQEPLPQTGDERAIQQALAYAKSKAEEYHQKVAKRSITAEQAVAELKADPRLRGSNNPNVSMIFTERAFEFRQNGVGREAIRSVILEQSAPGITEVIEVKLPRASGTSAHEQEKPLEDRDAEKVPFYYFFVDIHTIRTERGTQWLEDGLKKIKVNRYD